MKLTVERAINGFSRVDDPMNEDIYMMGSYAGFEVWKGNKGKNDFIYTRYTAFGRPVVVYHDSQLNEITIPILRMVVYKTPFTSASSFKEFCKLGVKGN